MDHEHKLALMIGWHERLLSALQHGRAGVPPSVDIDKLEEAYRMLESYEFRLVKKSD